MGVLDTEPTNVPAAVGTPAVLPPGNLRINFLVAKIEESIAGERISNVAKTCAHDAFDTLFSSGLDDG